MSNYFPDTCEDSWTMADNEREERAQDVRKFILFERRQVIRETLYWLLASMGIFLGYGGELRSTEEERVTSRTVALSMIGSGAFLALCDYRHRRYMRGKFQEGYRESPEEASAVFRQVREYASSEEQDILREITKECREHARDCRKRENHEADSALFPGDSFDSSPRD